MLSETDTATRTWIFKRKVEWDVYMNGASKVVPKLVVFGKEDGMNSIKFVDYIKAGCLTFSYVTEWLTVSIRRSGNHACLPQSSSRRQAT